MRIFLKLFCVLFMFCAGVFAQEEKAEAGNVIAWNLERLPIINGEFQDSSLHGRSLRWANRAKPFKYALKVYNEGVELINTANGDTAQENMGLFMVLMSYYHMTEMIMQMRMWATHPIAAKSVGRKIADEKNAAFIEFAETRFSEEQMQIFVELREQVHKGGKPLVNSSRRKIKKPYNKYFPLFAEAEAARTAK